MSKHEQTYVFLCPGRTVTVVVREHPDRVDLTVMTTLCGGHDDGDEVRSFEEFSAWMTPLLEPYEDDPRPFVINRLDTGQTAIVVGDADRSSCIVIDHA
jgi:hypothetical protein